MTSTATMLRQLRRVNAMRSPSQPRMFIIHLADDESIPQWIQDLQRPQDCLVVRYYPAGYFDEYEDTPSASYGWMTTASGRVLLLFRNGTKKWK